MSGNDIICCREQVCWWEANFDVCEISCTVLVEINNSSSFLRGQCELSPMAQTITQINIDKVVYLKCQCSIAVQFEDCDAGCEKFHTTMVANQLVTKSVEVKSKYSGHRGRPRQAQGVFLHAHVVVPLQVSCEEVQGSSVLYICTMCVQLQIGPVQLVNANNRDQKCFWRRTVEAILNEVFRMSSLLNFYIQNQRLMGFLMKARDQVSEIVNLI